MRSLTTRALEVLKFKIALMLSETFLEYKTGYNQIKSILSGGAPRLATPLSERRCIKKYQYDIIIFHSLRSLFLC